MYRPENPALPASPREARKEIMFQMLSGAGATAGVLVLIGVLLYGIYLVSLILPPESKEADDPTPDSFSMIVVEEEARLG